MTTGPLAGKTVLVAGGSGSIGRAVCRAVLEAGGNVALHGRRRASVDDAKEELTGLAGEGRLATFAADLTLQGEPESLCEAVVEAFGSLDAVVNCVVQAPPQITGQLAGTKPANYTQLLHESVTQVQWLLRAAALQMRHGGSFVTLVSDAALFAAPNQSLIAASRAGIAAFCRNAAVELARDGIRVNCVSTSYVSDSRIAAEIDRAGSGRLAKARQRAGLGLPECKDIANLCLFLVGPASTRLTGQVISVNGGLNA